MRYRRQLRSRIILSFVLFGLGLTALFATTTLVVRERLEEELIEATLQREVDKAVDLNRQQPELGAGIPFSGITGQVVAKHRFAEVPFSRQFDTGVYDISETDEKGQLRNYKLAVRKANDFWGFLQYDVTDQQQTRSVLFSALVLAVMIFSALSFVIAVLLSTRVLRPVTDLVMRVNAFQRDQKLEPLAPHFLEDEVGQLAAALDDYAQRLTELVERDRAFNADVSHELRTPLAVIRGAAELLLAQEDLSEKSRERIKRIERAVKQSTELTQALLLLSRNEKPNPEAESSDVCAVVEQVIDTHKLQLAGKSVMVVFEKEANCLVMAPFSALAVALGNLIGNAFKYTNEGEVRIRVKEDRVDVEDTGPGFPSGEADRLFERGYRGTTAIGKGAGLGLAIVKRLCDLYRWKVTLEPRRPQGAKASLIFEPNAQLD